MSDWYVYLLQCADDSLYTGITTDLERRLDEHNGELGSGLGAKYTRPRRPVELVYHETCATRSVAGQREAEIKRLSRTQKLALVANYKR